MRQRARRYFLMEKAAVYSCVAAAAFFTAAGVSTAFNGSYARSVNLGGTAIAAKSTGYSEHAAAPVSKKPPAVSAVSVPPASKTESKAAVSSEAPSSALPPESTAKAGEGWFEDAVFIGNSLTEGLRNYDGLDGASYYAGKGLMVDTVYTKKIVSAGGRQYTAVQAVKKNRFGKVYLMFGINELGWSSSQTFFDDYGKLIDDIKKGSSGVKIYVQSIMPVSAKKSESSTIYNNAKIREFNGRLEKLAKDKNAVYLDVASAVADGSGALPEGASLDGVHLNAQYCGKWCGYLQEHT